MAHPAPRAARRRGAPGPAGRLLLPPGKNPVLLPRRRPHAAAGTCLSPALPPPAPHRRLLAERAAAGHGLAAAQAHVRTQPPRRRIAPAALLYRTLPARSH